MVWLHRPVRGQEYALLHRSRQGQQLQPQRKSQPRLDVLLVRVGSCALADGWQPLLGCLGDLVSLGESMGHYGPGPHGDLKWT